MSENDKPTLRDYAEEYKISRWAVCKWNDKWSACDPAITDWSMNTDDPEFDTFAEAIEYAQEQART